MREAAKQCVLLEDHLNNEKKRCKDCIRKHFITIEGFLEEAISLEPEISERTHYRNLYMDWIKIQKEYVENNKIDEISKKIRMFRKPLIEEYYDTISEYNTN
jgi:hypothetical protein